MMRGFYAGLIAGCIGGMGVTLIRILEVTLSLPIVVYPYFLEFDIIINHLGYTIGTHGIIGAIFGIIYSRFYGGIPGKGVKKSLVFGSIVFLLSNIFMTSSSFLDWMLTSNEFYFIRTYEWLTAGIFIWVPYGLVLGVLYERLKL